MKSSLLEQYAAYIKTVCLFMTYNKQYYNKRLDCFEIARQLITNIIFKVKYLAMPMVQKYVSIK